jgi:hypothetical protein
VLPEQPRDLEQHRHPAPPVVRADDRLRAAAGIGIAVGGGPRIVVRAEKNPPALIEIVVTDYIDEMQGVPGRQNGLEGLERYVGPEPIESLRQVALQPLVAVRTGIPRSHSALIDEETVR